MDTITENEDLPGADEAEAAPVADDKPVGPFQRSDEELVKQINKWLKAASTHRADRLKERIAEWEALSGKQWSEDSVTRMQGQKRSVLTLNLLQTMMSAVEGGSGIERGRGD